MSKSLIFLAISLFLLTSCDGRRFYFYSPDEKQSFTVVKKGDYRYIYNGDSWIFPDTNYIKIDVSKVDETLDGLEVCWNPHGSGWEIFQFDCQILENKLDSTKFRFSCLPSEEIVGEYDFSQYRKPNCFSFNFYTEKLSNNSGGTIVK